MADLTVANTILEQLGGGKFRAMTGAHTFTGYDKALSFRLPGGGGFCKAGINFVKVQLNAEDTYDVTFVRLRGVKYTIVAERKSIYADQLREVFTRETGLDTSLGIPAAKQREWRAFDNRHED